MPGFFKRLIPQRFRTRHVTIPVVRLSGAITAEGGRFQSALNLSGVASALEEAFSAKRAPAVALVINSPGGSPVQSRLIYQRIRALAEEHDKKVLVFVEDVAASGGYLIALAGDEIIVDPTSIVGSIGVVSGGFGFTGLIDKLGIERRVYTSGENKALLDPFKPENEKDIAWLKDLQGDIHAVFIAMVKARRGTRLKDDPDLFTGLFWTGTRGVELGLADQLGSLREVLRGRYGETTEIDLIESPRSLFGRKLPGIRAGQAGGAAMAAALAEGAARVLEDKALWGRFGL
nr:S49 family peptidase [uncultured Gellertiella sp.]